MPTTLPLGFSALPDDKTSRLRPILFGLINDTRTELKYTEEFIIATREDLSEQYRIRHPTYVSTGMHYYNAVQYTYDVRNVHNMICGGFKRLGPTLPPIVEKELSKFSKFVDDWLKENAIIPEELISVYDYIESRTLSRRQKDRLHQVAKEMEAMDFENLEGDELLPYIIVMSFLKLEFYDDPKISRVINPDRNIGKSSQDHLLRL